MSPVTQYLADIQAAFAAGGTQEQSLYPALQTLLSTIGTDLKPRVFCISQPGDRGAGLPDYGLYTQNQLKTGTLGEPAPATLPERGVIEAKAPDATLHIVTSSEQVGRYWDRYGLVLVTNFRAFCIVGPDAFGRRINLEHFELAANESEFRSLCRQPAKINRHLENRFQEFLTRTLLHNAVLTRPEDVAWFLASFARDARDRIETAHADLPLLAEGRLQPVQQALELSLGIRFEGEKGQHFFRSTLVQTLFYGLFSAWVLWCRGAETEEHKRQFTAQTAAWHLRLPVLRNLFEHIYMPGTLGTSGLGEIMTWAADRLNRVDHTAFFARFQEDQAVQYFYEPFLEAFDPELRKQLGVWYTPQEVVDYMVARVDGVLREELGIADGLADPRVHVLDPCCGTGSYLVAILSRLHRAFVDQGKAALAGRMVKEAAMERIHGFEILPAPFVIAHMQLGLLLESMGAPLAQKSGHTAQPGEWPSVKLTNAMVDWVEQPEDRQYAMPFFADLGNETYYAHKIKRDTDILVVIGNPPYNSFAGVAEAESEERELTEAYRVPRNPKLRRPEGHGLNDLYVRFWRLAERRIAEMTGRGIACFITNYSWLDGLSHTAMRERFLEAFDRIWVDCLNGDKYKTGKLTPERKPDPSIFSTARNREGIQVGTAITLMARREDHRPNGHAEVHFRHFWGTRKHAQLKAAAVNPDGVAGYDIIEPPFELGLPFVPNITVNGYRTWPTLMDILPISIPGVNTSRDHDLTDLDEGVLRERIEQYFDPSRSLDNLSQTTPQLVKPTQRFDPIQTRQDLLERGINSGYFIRYMYRPFDTIWLYYHSETKLIDEKRVDLFEYQKSDCLFLVSRPKAEREFEGKPFFPVRGLADRHLIRPGSACFPIHDNQIHSDGRLMGRLKRGTPLILYMRDVAGSEEDLPAVFEHCLAIGYSARYLAENADVRKLEWPRIPLPATRGALEASAALGRQVADLLDPDTPVSGVTKGPLGRELRPLGAMRASTKAVNDLRVTAGWGRRGQNGVCMPGRGDARTRPWHPEELADIASGARARGRDPDEVLACLGSEAFDIYLNETEWWSGVPSRVWHYSIGGYQVVKKWLSYREFALLGRPLKTEEADYVSQMVRRLAALLLLEPTLDANYVSVITDVWPWPR